MTDRRLSQRRQTPQYRFMENLTDQAHPRMAVQQFPIADRDPRRFLTPML